MKRKTKKFEVTMIISRAPVRITFAGGDTDIKSYYEKNEGFLIACGINKYTTVILNRGYYDYTHLKYSQEEKVNDIYEIKHNIFRECLYYYGKWKTWHKPEPIEIVSMADYPVGCGLGTSGSFTVALIKGLLEYHNKPDDVCPKDQRTVAEHACYIEIDVLKEPIGKQDQYASAFGGINSYTFHKDGYVEVKPVKVDPVELNKRLLLFDTLIPRKSSDVLTNQVKEMEAGGEVLDKLNKVKTMAKVTQGLLEHGKFDMWGDLLNSYWNTRKTFSNKISNPKIDEAYELARKNGALGGKLQGAGGGGFLMFYAREKHHESIIKALERLGLKHMPFEFDFKGVHSYTIQ
jgi:D-glycero-alpha-D-manno-heptose-7-phosphate kinase